MCVYMCEGGVIPVPYNVNSKQTQTNSGMESLLKGKGKKTFSTAGY